MVHYRVDGRPGSQYLDSTSILRVARNLWAIRTMSRTFLARVLLYSFMVCNSFAICKSDAWLAV